MSPEELERKAKDYREVTAPAIYAEVTSGRITWPAAATRAMAELSDMQFGLTNEEYAQVVGEGPNEMERYEKLCKVAGWLIVHDGTTIMHTPGEILRGHSSGWPGLTPPEETRPLIDLLASDEEQDFQLLKRSLEELVGRTQNPFPD